MTALTKDRKTEYREGVELEHKVAASTKIYAGSLVALNESGYAVPAADTASLRFVGVAREQVDNSLGANGDKSVAVRKTGLHRFAASGMAITDIGKPAFIFDDQTVAKSGVTNWIACGTIAEFISAGEVGVNISGAAAAQSDADCATADAATQTASYVQADVQSIATLANALKTDHNDLLAKLRAARILAG